MDRFDFAKQSFVLHIHSRLFFSCLSWKFIQEFSILFLVE